MHRPGEDGSVAVDPIMDIDSHDDALLLEAARQFDCADRLGYWLLITDV